MSHYGPPSSRDDRFQGLTRLNQAGVPKALGGRGVGVALVRCDVEGACAAGLKTIPLCPLAKARIQKHKEWQDVLA